MICKRCGAQISDFAKVCIFCGEEVEPTEELIEDIELNIDTIVKPKKKKRKESNSFAVFLRGVIKFIKKLNVFKRGKKMRYVKTKERLNKKLINERDYKQAGEAYYSGNAAKKAINAKEENNKKATANNTNIAKEKMKRENSLSNSNEPAKDSSYDGNELAKGNITTEENASKRGKLISPKAKSEDEKGQNSTITKGTFVFAFILIAAAFLLGRGIGNFTSGLGGGNVSKRGEMNEPVGNQDIRTVMIYMVGSDLETGNGTENSGGAASADLEEMLEADIPDKVNVVVECGGAKDWKHPDVPDGEATIFSVENGSLVEEKKLGKHSMTAEGDLEEFVEYSAKEFPAANYTLILWDHGGGIPIGFGMDELSDEDMMSCYEIKRELDAADIYFDAVIFDACNMCSLEMGKALEDRANYMVGAESLVNGVGIYYTGFLPEVDGAPSDFCETIVKDYMKIIRAARLVGCMSVIRLEKIGAVYDTYIEYVREIAANVNQGGYLEFAKAREECKSFNSIDTVDLLSLTHAYPTESSSTLMNMAVNVVDYTDDVSDASDENSSAGHGIMVYCPFDCYEKYQDGRRAFLELGYDQEIVDFYDSFMSQKLAYLGQDVVSRSGGKWYKGDYSAEVEAAGGVATERPIGTMDLGDYTVVDVPENIVDSVVYVSQDIYVEDGNTGRYRYLGQDYTCQFDDEFRYCFLNPDYWLYINGQQACYICNDVYLLGIGEDCYKRGYVYAKVNGKEALLFTNYNFEEPVSIQGYSLALDPEYKEYDSTVFALKDTDVIELVDLYWNPDDTFSYQVSSGPIKASELEVDFYSMDLDSYHTMGRYTLHDVYGNLYSTDYFDLASHSFARD